MSRVLFNEGNSDKLFAERDYQRLLLDELLEESRTYKNSLEYQELLDFVSRFPEMAPFNAMLLHIQKPGLHYAATSRSWREKFGRRVKERARPLIVLRPFGPVDFVYDVVDTEGGELPEDVRPFSVKGELGWDWVKRVEGF